MIADSYWTPERQRRTAWILWGVLYLVVAAIILPGNGKTVTPGYRAATVVWFESRDIYAGDSGAGFLYLPAACLAYAPVAYLPHLPAELLWRVFTIGTFVAGIRRLAGLAGRDSGKELFLLTTLISIPLAWSSSRNGQMTLPMAGMMMLAAADVADRKWWRSALWLSLGLALKPHTFILSLLVGALYPRMSWRLALGMVVVFLAPFLTQHPEYVVDQYGKFAVMLRGSIDLAERVLHAQFFGMLEVAGLDVPQRVQMVVRVIAAALTLAACWLAGRRNSPSQAGVLLFTYAMCYLMLFNPRTENNTYSALAPAIGVCFAQAVLVRRNRIEAAFLFLVAAAIVGTYEIGRLFSPPERAIWLSPLACSCFTVWLAARLGVQFLPRSWYGHLGRIEVLGQVRRTHEGN